MIRVQSYGSSPTRLRAESVVRDPFVLGPMPVGRPMVTTDVAWVRRDVRGVFDIVRAVEHWPALLAHYRLVRFRERTRDGGGVVEMSANRPFGLFNWPTWWLSQMTVDHDRPVVRFRHIGGVTTGMDVEWSFAPKDGGTQVSLVHVWDGPTWPLIGIFAATQVIGPIFVHGIASRTLAGLAAVAEAGATVSVAADGRGESRA